MLYKQCRLSKKNQSGNETWQVSYIPAKFAVVGKILKLKDNNGEWDDGWKVISAGVPVEEKLLPDYRKQIREHRKNTGDSMSKTQMAS